MADMQFDILIVGGSLGGVAAAIRAGRTGAAVCLLEETDWLGGQLTAQGVSTPDDNQWIAQDMMGCTASYHELRQRVRRHYRENFALSPEGRARQFFCPGNCWVNDQSLSMEPRVGMQLLQQMMALSNLTVRLNTRVRSVQMEGDTIAAVTAAGEDGVEIRFVAPMVLDATELGELFPLTGAEGVDWVIGAESAAETEEPDAPPAADPRDVQPFTFPLLLEHRPAGENPTIDRPDDFDTFKPGYKISDGCIQKVFADVPTPDCPPPNAWWTYRRIIAAANFNEPAFPHELAQINTDANDYKEGVIPTNDAAADQLTLEQARRKSLGYLFWLQTECPRDEGGNQGYRELQPRGDLSGATGGLSPAPYIRESRRIKALKTVVEQEIVRRDFQGQVHQTGPRAALFADSCGIGSYTIDIHRRGELPTCPFQIPLGALIPQRITNLLPACKNLGVTHLTNGAYRVHPVEWNVGEAAGALAVFCRRRNLVPRQVHDDPTLVRAFQRELLQAGVPLFWWPDIPADHSAFAAAHLLALNRIFEGDEALLFRPDDPLTAAAAQVLEQRVGQSLNLPQPLTRGEAAVRIAAQMGL